MGTISGHECGKDYFKYYKEVPPLSDPLWRDYRGFVEWRKKRFIELMKVQYDISIQCAQPKCIIEDDDL
jgi:hypothetical protein